MPDLQTYMERVAGVSPSHAGFNRRGGGVSHYSIMIGDDGQQDNNGNPVNPAITDSSQVYKAIIEILGATHTHPDGYRLNRTLPKADPFYHWLFADEIGEIRGKGKMQKLVSTPVGNEEAPPLDNVAFYPLYEFSPVVFTPRPYAVVQDDHIHVDALASWVNPAGTPRVDLGYAEEWLRYTDVERIPVNEYLTAQMGQFVIDAGYQGLGPVYPSPNDRAAPNGQIRMLVQKEGIKVTWYEVPYAYVNTGDSLVQSYFSMGLGCINQFDWWDYPRGTLLFEAMQVVRYTPPVPNITFWDGDTAIFAANKLCDITMIFSFMNPPLGHDDAGNVATPTVPAGMPNDPGPIQIVQAGHNLVPYAHMMEWFYARTKITGYSSANNRPIFPSFPFQKLFTNPGVTA